ncbi:sulfatase [Tateyamaria sp.]|uniref:sulfatase family protein n=1 Tax=Tateyamaria sp. TaxID=1929288 RepID=UPI00329AD3C2
MNTATRPNVLMVVFDSLGAHDVRLHAGDLPTLCALFDRSLNFANAYAPCPESSPARASLFTGLDMAAHGVWTDGVALPKRDKTMPEVFEQNGYHTWLVGRRHLAGVSHWGTEHARANEYDHFDWAHGALHRSRQNAYLMWLQKTAPAAYARIFPQQANPDATTIPQTQYDAMAALPDELSFNTWVAQQACVRIGTAPFFGVVGFVVGQSMGATGAGRDALDPRVLRQADAALAVILKALPENTVIALTAGRGSTGGATPPLNEAAVNVPLALCVPGGTAEEVAGAVSTIDVASTFYAAAQVRPPQRLQGQCLIANEPRGWALSRLRRHDQPHQTAFVDARWKLVMIHGAAQSLSLFDLSNDPNEEQNLADDPAHQGKLEEMMDQMIDARVALEDRTEPRIANF